jgi:hypothetical protein
MALPPATKVSDAFASYEARTSAAEALAAAGSSGLAGTFDLNASMQVGDDIFEPLAPYANAALSIIGLPITQIALEGNRIARGSGRLVAGQVYTLPLKWTAPGQPDKPFTLTFKAVDTSVQPDPFDTASYILAVNRPDVYVVKGAEYADLPVSLIGPTGAPYLASNDFQAYASNINNGNINTYGMYVQKDTFYPEKASRQYLRVIMPYNDVGPGVFSVQQSGFEDRPEPNGSTTVHVVDHRRNFPAGYVERPFVDASTPLPTWTPPARAPDYSEDFKTFNLTFNTPTDTHTFKVDEWPGPNPGAYGFVRPGVSKTVSGRVVQLNEVMPLVTDAQGVQCRQLRITDCQSDPVVIAGSSQPKRFASANFQIWNLMSENYGWVELDSNLNAADGIDYALWRYKHGNEELDYMETLGGAGTNYSAAITFHRGNYTGKKGFNNKTIGPSGRKIRRWYFSKERVYYFVANADGSNCQLQMSAPNYLAGKTWDYFNFMIEGPGGAGGGGTQNGTVFPSNYDTSQVFWNLYGFKVWVTNGDDITPQPTWTTPPYFKNTPAVGVPLTPLPGVISYGYAAEPLIYLAGTLVPDGYAPVPADQGKSVKVVYRADGMFGLSAYGESATLTIASAPARANELQVQAGSAQVAGTTTPANYLSVTGYVRMDGPDNATMGYQGASGHYLYTNGSGRFGCVIFNGTTPQFAALSDALPRLAFDGRIIGVRAFINCSGAVVTEAGAARAAKTVTYEFDFGSGWVPGGTAAANFTMTAKTVPVSISDLNFRSFQMRDGTGALLVDADFTAAQAGATSYTDKVSKIWAFSGGAAIVDVVK